MLRMKNFFAYLHKTPLTQWLVVALLHPLAYVFGKAYHQAGFSALMPFVSSFTGESSAEINIIYVFVVLSCFSGACCYLLMRKAFLDRAWILLGFSFNGYAVFYALVVYYVRRVFPEYKGILFWRFNGIAMPKLNTAYIRMVCWLLFLLLILFAVMLGIYYIYSVGLEVERI